MRAISANTVTFPRTRARLRISTALAVQIFLYIAVLASTTVVLRALLISAQAP